MLESVNKCNLINLVDAYPLYVGSSGLFINVFVINASNVCSAGVHTVRVVTECCHRGTCSPTRL